MVFGPSAKREAVGLTKAYLTHNLVGPISAVVQCLEHARGQVAALQFCMVWLFSSEMQEAKNTVKRFIRLAPSNEEGGIQKHMMDAENQEVNIT